METLIDSASLEADAVVPQCLDNQYVSDDVFSYMMTQEKASFDDPVVQGKREKEVRTEFIRSLVYSSQVIIQRAYLINNQFLYKNYSPTPRNRQNLEAFARLIREKAIVPFLFNESSLEDNMNFDTDAEGIIALKTLLEEVGDDLTCIQLAIDHSTNTNKTRTMTRDFSSRLLELKLFQKEEHRAMASELFTCPDLRFDDDTLKKFGETLDDFAAYVDRKAVELKRSSEFLRNQVYVDNFIEPGGQVVKGNFKKANNRATPFMFELKKYVDLVYNTNLPDTLNRYTFTPMRLPSRMTLQNSAEQNYRYEDIDRLITDPEFLTYLRQTFMAEAQKGMYLPQLNEMSIVDVVRVRALPQWEVFKKAQIKILQNPIQCLDLIEQFNAAFNDFQSALSIWFLEQHQQKTIENRYYNYVSIGLSVGGSLIGAGTDLIKLGDQLFPFDVHQLRATLPANIDGCAVKLMVSVFDIYTKTWDKARSYNIELMQTNDQLDREDVIEMVSRAVRKSGDGIPPYY